MKYGMLYLLLLSAGGAWGFKRGDPNTCDDLALAEIECEKRELSEEDCKKLAKTLDPICCPGYTFNMKKDICEAISPAHKKVKDEKGGLACEHGYCTGKGDSDCCNPICTKPCVHGICAGPDICICDEGYSNSTGECLPVCEGCEHGDCIKPNHCNCHGNYTWNEEKKACTPMCGDCRNGTCVAPYTCECLKGFQKGNTSSLCEPVCSSCDGECVAPEVCIFSADCKKCNGKCTDGVCTCADGRGCRNILDCHKCEGSCAGGACKCANGTVCRESVEEVPEFDSPSLASIQLTWMLGGGVLVLLLIIIAVVIRHIYRNTTIAEKNQGNASIVDRSVVCTLSNTLKPPKESYQKKDYEGDPETGNQTSLLNNFSTSIELRDYD